MKRWFIFIALFIVSSTIQAQDIGIDYFIQRENEAASFTAEQGFRTFATMPDYLIAGWNTSGKYFMTYFDDPERLGEMVILSDYRTPESFPMVTDMWISLSNPIDFGAEALTFMVYTDDMLVSEDEQGIGILRANVYDWAFDEGLSAITPLGSIPYGVGCGGGGVFSALTQIYNTEVRGDTTTEFNSRHRKVLASTPYGIVHSNSCTAIRTYLTDPETVEFVELSDNLRWPVISPDGAKVAGTSGNQLQVVDLETLDITDVFEADAPIVSITWSEDSSQLYFVARQTNGDLLPFEDPDHMLDTIKETLFENAPKPDELLRWGSAVYRYDFNTEPAQLLYNVDAYAIGNMTWVDGTLVFNQIEHPTAWLQAIIDGGDPYDSRLIPVTLIQFDVESREATVLGDDFRGVYVRPR